ncbi:MAG: iron-containing alcohol dehydrogenase [Bacteroidota bacterium]
MNFSPQILRGSGVLAELSAQLKKYVVFISESEWDSIHSFLEHEPIDLFQINTLEESQLEIHADNIQDCEYVLGVGGSLGIEAAKFAAFQKFRKLITIPGSLASSEYAHTRVRTFNYQEEQVLGEISPDTLVLDFQILGEIPPDIHAEGLAELFAMHTAVFDCEHAKSQGKAGENYSHKAIDDAKQILSDLEVRVGDISMGTERGLEALADAQLKQREICREAESENIKKGSEHVFKQFLEEQAQRSFESAGLLALCTLLMARLQNNQADSLYQQLKESGIFFQPAHLGLQPPQLARSLQDLRYYVQRRQGLPYTCLNDAYIDEEWGFEMIQDLEF